MQIKRALVPVDGSEVSIEAVRIAAELAPKQGWEVLLLHAIEQPPMPGFAFPEDVKKEVLNVLYNDAKPILANAVNVLSSAGVKTETKIVHGSAADVIIQEVVESGCEIVIIGSIGVGRGALGHLLLGSVAENVIREVRVPVLLVRERTVSK